MPNKHLGEHKKVWGTLNLIFSRDIFGLVAKNQSKGKLTYICKNQIHKALYLVFMRA